MPVNKLPIDDVVDKIKKLLPEDMLHVREEITRNIKATLSASLKDMDLVTREEFDVQARLLAKTRARLEELEAILQRLEQQQDPEQPGK